jgi:hypothetical protein
VLLGEQARLRLAESHGPASAALHLAQEEDIDANQHEHRQPAHENAAEVDTLFRRSGVDLVDVLDQHRHELIVRRRARRVGRELLHAVSRLAEGAADRVALDADVLNLPCLDCPHEVGIGDRVAGGLGRAALEDAVEQREQQNDDDPQSSVTIERVHFGFREMGLFPKMGCGRWGASEKCSRNQRLAPFPATFGPDNPQQPAALDGPPKNELASRQREIRSPP